MTRGDAAPARRCRDCGEHPADTWLSGHGPLCDRRTDTRVASYTRLPPLPEPPAPVQLTGPDGRHHLMRYRVSRAPTGITVRMQEHSTPPGEGYQFGVLGDHDADLADLTTAVHAAATAEIGHHYLDRDGSGWQLAGDEVAGRFEFDPETGSAGPHRVIIDGRSLTWEELGTAMGSLEGWRFRILIDDPIIDHRREPT